MGFDFLKLNVAGKVNAQAQRPDLYIGIDTLEDEFVLTSAEYLLSLANLRWTRSGKTIFIVHLCLHLRDCVLLPYSRVVIYQTISVFSNV